jgi:hypothetical protein
MFHQLADHLMNVVVSKEIERLRSLNLSDLIALPSINEGEAVIDGTVIPFIIWHDLLPTGDHRIVVQANRKKWLGIVTYLTADGFAVTTSGSLRGLADDELDSFR